MKAALWTEVALGRALGRVTFEREPRVGEVVNLTARALITGVVGDVVDVTAMGSTGQFCIGDIVVSLVLEEARAVPS